MGVQEEIEGDCLFRRFPRMRRVDQYVCIEGDHCSGRRREMGSSFVQFIARGHHPRVRKSAFLQPLHQSTPGGRPIRLGPFGDGLDRQPDALTLGQLKRFERLQDPVGINGFNDLGHARIIALRLPSAQRGAEGFPCLPFPPSAPSWLRGLIAPSLLVFPPCLSASRLLQVPFVAIFSSSITRVQRNSRKLSAVMVRMRSDGPLISSPSMCGE